LITADEAGDFVILWWDALNIRCVN